MCTVTEVTWTDSVSSAQIVFYVEYDDAQVWSDCIYVNLCNEIPTNINASEFLGFYKLIHMSLHISCKKI